MTLDYLNTGVCLTVTLFTLGGVYYANTVKNNISNTIKSELDSIGTMSLKNFKKIKQEIGFITKAEIYVIILFIITLSQAIVCIGSWLYSKIENISNSFLSCSENILLTLFIIGIIISIIIIPCLIFSPRQNLLSAKWDLTN